MYMFSMMILTSCVKKGSTEGGALAEETSLAAPEGEESQEEAEASEESNSPPSGVVMGALDKELIDAEIGEHMASIKGCYAQQLEESPSLSGRIVVKFVIAKDGSVSKADPKEDTVGSEAVTQCILDQFSQMQFPEPTGGGIVIVSYPFTLSPAEE